MNPKMILIGVVSLLILGSGTYVLIQGDSRPKRTADTVSPSPDIIVSPSPTATANPAATSAVTDTQVPASTKAPGKYVNYSENILRETSGQRVLFFHASWCPQCRSVEKGIKADGVPDGFVIIKVDYDSHQDLRKKYGVKLQTTFVKLDAAGNGTANYVAYDEPTFDAVKRNFLN